ncbi:hypothetical protein J4210_00285 [Candidatus Woesearchaeota archaeon]|nr:hypothetical protein [Candidatus Woesearchaeota archaeon]
MSKKCIICNAEAGYMIKDTSDYYCGECAEEHFGDITLLVKMEAEAQKLKELFRDQIASPDENEGGRDGSN